MHGPEPPPGFIHRPPSPPLQRPAASGVSPASAPRDSGEELRAAAVLTSSANDGCGTVDLIGPLPADLRLLDEARHARSSCGAAGQPDSRRRKRSGGGGAAREEWMLVPPESFAPSLTGKTSKPAVDKSWTRVGGGDGAANSDSDSASSDAALERRQRAAAEAKSARMRDAEMEALAAAVASGGGESKKSLFELHRVQLAKEAADKAEKAQRKQRRKLKRLESKERKRKKDRKSKKKKKKSSSSSKGKKKSRHSSASSSSSSSTSSSSTGDSSAGAGRVPFNRDTDLAIQGLDAKVKQSIIARSQASMSSRFNHGGQKFL